MLDLEKAIIALLSSKTGEQLTSLAIAQELNRESDTELIFKLLNRLAVNNRSIAASSQSPVTETLFSST